METLIPFTLFGSGILFGVVLVLLFITLITLDLKSDGWSATLAVCLFVGLNHFWGTFDIWSIITFWNVFLYLLIGFFFSVLRTYAKGRELSKYDERWKVYYKKDFKLKEHVFRWWFLGRYVL